MRASICVVAVMVVACGDGTRGGRGGSAAVATVHALDAFPARSLADWKSYADHVAVVAVVADKELPPGAEVKETGDGLIGRETEMRVERVFWSAPEAPALPEVIRMTQAGWIVNDGKRRPFVIEGAPRVEVGERFVMPVVLMQLEDDLPRQWSALTQSSQMPLRDGRVASDPEGNSGTGVRAALAGMTIDEVASAVENQAADPVAGKYRHLRPYERLKAVRRELKEGRPPGEEAP